MKTIKIQRLRRLWRKEGDDVEIKHQMRKPKSQWEDRVQADILRLKVQNCREKVQD